MSTEFVQFISTFEREHQDTFLLIQHTVDNVEQFCHSKNRKLSSRNSIEADTFKEEPTSKCLSSASMSDMNKFSRTTAASSNFAGSCLDDPIVGSLDNLLEPDMPLIRTGTRTLPVISEIIHSDRNKKEFKNQTYCELALTKNIQSEGRDTIQANSNKNIHDHFRPERIPFFALNIKTINIKATPRISELGSEDQTHSPILQAKTSLDAGVILEPSSGSMDSPKIEVRFPIKAAPYSGLKRSPQLDLDDHILEEDFLKHIRRIYKNSSSRREIFQQVMEHIFSSKNFQEDAHKNYPRKEVVYCNNIVARELLKHLKNLLTSLGAEDVRVQMKIVDEKRFIETHFGRFLRNFGITEDFINYFKQIVSVDEIEIRTLYDRIVKISTHLPSRSKSKEAVRKSLYYFQKLIERFPLSHANWNDRAPIDAEVGIKFITVRKLVEKATEVVDTLMAEKLKHITILTYDHFIKPLTLMLLLTKRYYTPQPFMMTNQEYNHFKAHHSCTRRKRIIELLAFWVEHRPNDFTTNSDLLALLVIFLESIFKYHKEHASQQDFMDLYQEAENLIDKSNKKGKKDLVRPSTRKIDRVQTQLGIQPKFMELVPNRHTYDVSGTNDRKDTKSSDVNSDEAINRITECDSESSIVNAKLRPSRFVSCRRGSKTPSINDQSRILEWDSREIAKQLTLIDAKIFKKIQINQMMLKRWTKTTCADDCRGILEAISRFNSLSFWVQYVIITATDSDQRTALLNKFITIAAECLELQNFMSSHSIFTAFLRLQNTNLWKVWGENEENFRMLEEIYKSPTFFQDMENTLKTLSPPSVPNIPFFTNRFFRLQDNVIFSIKLEQKDKYLKSSQLEQLAGYSLLIKKFQGQIYGFGKNSEMHPFFKKDYKLKPDIDFESEDAEEILRSKILEVTANEFE